jgi:hypothetical protein
MWAPDDDAPDERVSKPRGPARTRWPVASLIILIFSDLHDFNREWSVTIVPTHKIKLSRCRALPEEHREESPVIPTIPWWDRSTLGGGPIALVVFPQSLPQATQQLLPTIGAASTRERSVLLLTPDLGDFLRCHPDADVVCHDAARLHGLLRGFFVQSKDGEALRLLWRMSGTDRLLDIQILDQHVRRFGGDYAALGLPLCDLAARYTQITLPVDEEVSRRIATAWSEQHRGLKEDVVELVLGTARAVLEVYERLRAESETIQAAIEKATLPVQFNRPRAPVVEEQLRTQTDKVPHFLVERARERRGDTQVTSATRIDWIDPTVLTPMRLLGVSIEVRGAIAIAHQSRHRAEVDRDRLPILQQKATKLYADASHRLGKDFSASRCFKYHRNGTVLRNPQGLPETRQDELQKWLEKVALQLVDTNRVPAMASLPRGANGELAEEPDRWGFWVGCNAGLGAWRDLCQASAMFRYAEAPETTWPGYHLVPVLQERAPRIKAVWQGEGAPLQPRKGYVFVVATFSALNLHCLARVCQQFRQVNGRFQLYFRGQDNPLGLIVAELYERWEQRGMAGLDIAPEEWVRLTIALLDTLPLCLEINLLRNYLKNDYNIVLSIDQLRAVVEILQNEVVTELAAFIDDDTWERISRSSGQPQSEVMRDLWRDNHPETTLAAIRNELLDQRPGLVRSLLASAATGPADVAVTSQRILRQPDRSLGGRVIPPCSPLEVRRLQYLYALDEVRKAVAYALVAAGHELVAIEREQFLLHVPLAEANDQWMMGISKLAKEAARPLLRYLTPTCEVGLLKES